MGPGNNFRRHDSNSDGDMHSIVTLGDIGTLPGKVVERSPHFLLNLMYSTLKLSIALYSILKYGEEQESFCLRK